MHSFKQAGMVLGLLVLTHSAWADGSRVAVKAGQLLDVQQGTLQKNQVILISDGRITQVGPAAKVSIPEGSRIIDLSGKTVLPGLIDMHD
ncbi:MAG: amidohydrolase family protein, partial [Gammaproteobacteria bacterium]|nr:amidohydrolase family protein [Gammaproteobacteria bacterium]